MASLLCGVDEAGRGALAGPVVAAAVVFGDGYVDGLRDSKELSPARRAQLAEEIREECMSFALGVADEREVDRLNVRTAAALAMQRAVSGIVVCPDLVQVDGDFAPDFPYPAQSVIGGDRKVEEIMAASILAKTARDEMMMALDKKRPGYGFARHKGYGTREHLSALARLGACPEHRKTFSPVRGVLEKNKE